MAKKNRLVLNKCCDCGTYDHQVPMPIGGRVASIDYCIADLVAGLNVAGIETLASCCGHGKFPGNLILAGGRHLIVCDKAQFDKIFMDWGGARSQAKKAGKNA